MLRVYNDGQGARVGLATRPSTPLVSTSAEVESCSNGYCCLTSCVLQDSVFKVCKVRLLSIPWPGVCVMCVSWGKGATEVVKGLRCKFLYGCDVTCDKLAIQVFPF